ncbi:MAG: DnaJ domain-containing protein [Gammaproteobacteria bacterium]|nr:DnaJ domain-containing protein [Gammaproteobacteria bacterium]
MKYKDYYGILGVAQNANVADIKKAYRKLAHKYHPDVSKEANAEQKFKEVAEAYETLKNPEKRAAYDQLGKHRPGEEFRPPPDWQQQHGAGSFSFEDFDLSDLFAGLRGGGARSRGRGSMAGEDYEVPVHLTLEDAFRGSEVELNLSMPEYNDQGLLRRVPQVFKTRIPKGVIDGQRLRVPGKGGKGFNGGRNGDLYLTIALHPHALFRVNGHDLYIDLPLAPWEAVLGTSVDVPTLSGAVRLKVPPGIQAGQKLRIAKRGLPKPHAGEGDLFALVQIAAPHVISERERALYQQLANISKFNPRGNFRQESRNESRTH